ncbi:hypothetical protein PDJAM_G00171510 [Pangasius djambal]|uniref:Uncharacterized protein n=1 Tax=Pangasius djambal TaxID=1691987 RepID=A0ACC5ZPH7_9TELE|nr:hypothetical protein [Pangasius djambal]
MKQNERSALPGCLRSHSSKMASVKVWSRTKMGSLGDRCVCPPVPFRNRHLLTDWHGRVAVNPGESVPAPAAVEAVEVPGAAARAGEEAKRPALAIVLAHVRVLRPVSARVRLH